MTGSSKMSEAPMPAGPSLLTSDDLYLFNEGTHGRLYEKMGAHPLTYRGREGAAFAVWAPDAKSVSVAGDFNNWDKQSNPLEPRADSGIWEGFVAGVPTGSRYKYCVTSRYRSYSAFKGDPFAFHWEVPPATASVVWDLEYKWGDAGWMSKQAEKNSLTAPMSIYEMHIGSWARVPEEANRPLTYRELAERLPGYLNDLGFTHVEFMPVMEHPFYGSWGYQTTGYFAPTSRYGNPQDFMHLIDRLHQEGIAVILDWVGSHFPTDEHGLAYFDGTHLFEHEDPQRGFHPDWESFIFNYGRNEVRSFLLSSALYWLDKFHADGLRVDAVASMIYRDYSRKAGEWSPNEFGGTENLEATSFLRSMNQHIYGAFPNVQTIAEESTAWPNVSRPVYSGGLGFGMKWDMGWMHDTLRFMSKDPVHRKYQHNDLTFRLLYAFTENFVLALSHDEVVHGKGSLIGKMPGDEWQRFANLRLLFGLMYGHCGKKLIFMGGEFGQIGEWRHDSSLDWHVLAYPLHAGARQWVAELNRIYRLEPSLHELDFDPAGFEWVDASDWEASVISFIRKSSTTKDVILAVYNFTPVPRSGYLVGVGFDGEWTEIANSDDPIFGGAGWTNPGSLNPLEHSMHGRGYSLALTLPPLGCVFIKGVPRKAEKRLRAVP